jgi:hypothetical protein
MKIAHFAVAAVLSSGSAFVAAGPAAAMPRSAAPAASAEKSAIVQVRHRHYRHYRDYDRYGWHHRRYYRDYYRDWRAERHWRDDRGWRYRDRYYDDGYYRPHRNGVYLRLDF